MASYIVKVLQGLKDLAQTHDNISRNQLMENVDCDLKERQLESALHNFSRSQYNLIKRIDSQYMALNKPRIEEIYDLYCKGKIKLWYAANGIERRISKHLQERHHEPISKRDIAKYAIYNHAKKFDNDSVTREPLSVRKYHEIALQLNFDLTIKDIGNAIHQNKKWYEITKYNSDIRYFPKKNFFEDNKKLFEKIEAFLDPQRQSAKTKNILIKFSYDHVFYGIIAAYKKPLTIKNIIAIAKKHGYKLKEKSTRNIPYRDSSKYLIKHFKVGRSNSYQLNADFFSEMKPFDYMEALPDLAERIKKRFDQYSVSKKLAEQQQQQQETAQEQPKEQPIATEKSSPENTQAQESDELIEAANVGAAIIAYIQKLKKKNKEVDQTEFDALQLKYDDIALTVVNQRNRISSLDGQAEKMRKIIDNQNNQIKNLTHFLNQANLEIEELKNRKMPSSFKLKEVAKIRHMIKG